MNPLLSRLSYRSAGESHGPAVTVVLEGLPRGLELDVPRIDGELRRRQGGAGRGGRQRIERDAVQIVAGVRHGLTLGSPLCLVIPNRDHTIESLPEPVRPRPGHADLAGCYRYLDHDIRATLERASARETVGRVAAGAVCAQLLERLGCGLLGFVRSVGRARLPSRVPGEFDPAELRRWRSLRDQTRLYTLAAGADRAMLAEVGEAAKEGDTLGGVVEVRATGVLPGLGSHLQWHERLDARLAAALMSIPAFKGVEIGLGFEAARRRGSRVHDEILPAESAGLQRASNHAGGLEGGTTNGQPIVVRGAMKPISTLRRPLRSVDLTTGAPAAAGYERSDVCAVAAASVIAEAMVALILADALLARVGGETLSEVEDRAAALAEAAAALGRPRSGSGSGGRSRRGRDGEKPS